MWRCQARTHGWTRHCGCFAALVQSTHSHKQHTTRMYSFVFCFSLHIEYHRKNRRNHLYRTSIFSFVCHSPGGNVYILILRPCKACICSLQTPWSDHQFLHHHALPKSSTRTIPQQLNCTLHMFNHFQNTVDLISTSHAFTQSSTNIPV